MQIGENQLAARLEIRRGLRARRRDQASCQTVADWDASPGLCREGGGVRTERGESPDLE